MDLILKRQDGDSSVLVEVKKVSTQSRVSVETVRKLLSAVSTVGASLGVLVATGGFTPAALALSASAPILLCTLEELLAAKSEKELLSSEGSER